MLGKQQRVQSFRKRRDFFSRCGNLITFSSFTQYPHRCSSRDTNFGRNLLGSSFSDYIYVPLLKEHLKALVIG